MGKRQPASLFELLPPAGSDNVKESSPAENSAQPKQSFSATELNSIPQTQPNKRSPEPSTHPNPTTSSISSKSDQGDHFYLIVASLLIFSVVTGLFGYQLGKKYGFARGREQGVALRSHQILDSKISKKQKPPVNQIKKTKPLIKNASFRASQLPVKVQEMTADQKKALLPPEKIKRYTLQVQTFGPYEKKATQLLIQSLQEKGFETFGDMKKGIVYVGRFHSFRSKAAKELKNKISEFNWRNRDFKGAFFQRIPSNLLSRN